MADEEQSNVVRIDGRPLASGGDGPHDPGMEARVAKLEAAVEHIQTDVREIKSTLSRLATAVDRMDGFLQAILPTLATKAEIARLATKDEMLALRLEIERRPTRRQAWLDIAMIVGAIGAILTIGSRLAN